MSITNIFTQKYSQWKEQWEDSRVQKLTSDTGDFVSAESTLIVSGPPTYAGDEQELIPVGLVQNATITQNKQIQQLHEVGSRQMFTVPGRTFASVGIARVLFDGPSLLFALTSYYSGADVVIPNIAAGASNTEKPAVPYPEPSAGKTKVTESTTPDQLGAYWGNLNASVFNRPLGLGFIFMDIDSTFYGGIYLEKCFVQSYNMGISAQQTILLENVQIRTTNIRPIVTSDNASSPRSSYKASQS